jgi:hypothetical protein
VCSDTTVKLATYERGEASNVEIRTLKATTRDQFDLKMSRSTLFVTDLIVRHNSRQTVTLNAIRKQNFSCVVQYFHSIRPISK